MRRDAFAQGVSPHPEWSSITKYFRFDRDKRPTVAEHLGVSQRGFITEVHIYLKLIIFSNIYQSDSKGISEKK